jgi:sec-independent protein translocase protein TatA
MALAMFGLGVPELLIILAVVLLLFGGSRLAGLGKSTGRALKEFKEETKGLKPGDKRDDAVAYPPVANEPTIAPTWQQPTQPPGVQDPNVTDLRKDV